MIDLKDYIKVYKQAVSKDICKSSVNELQSVEWEQHTFYNPKEDTTFQHNYEPLVCYNEINSYPILMKTVWNLIKQYIKDLNHPWFNTWNGFSNLKFIKYSKESEMHIHWDNIHSMFDGERKGIPTLTVIGLLNNNFKGGSLIINNEDTNLMEGDIIIFPSSFMYPHEVSKIVDGYRYSFASWVF